jgi:pyruvate formate-lyase activating enzyme-like uncharacterized protein
MVKRTLELFECDKCGQEAKRYSVVFDEGTLVLDRCTQHARQLEKLREEKGEWLTPRNGKTSFHKSSLSEVRAAVEQARR